MKIPIFGIPRSKKKPISMHFEPVRKGHEDMLKQWFQQDYIAEFWHGAGLQGTLKSISLFVNGEETQFTLWIAYDRAIPFGYLMTSKVEAEKDLLYAKYLNASSKAITLDLLIGDPSYLGKGLAQLMIKELLSQKFGDITDVFIDPGVNNKKAIHVYEKVGFQKLKEFIPEWDPSCPCLLMHLKKDPLNTVEVYEIKPENFKATVQVAACYLEIEGFLLLLECSDSKPEAGKWGVPAGKLEANELPKEAAKRELFEETGIQISNSCLHSLGTLYIRKPEVNYEYHLFKITLSSTPEVRLSNEHPAYLWAGTKDLETLPLMAGAKEALNKYRSAIAPKRLRSKRGFS